MLLCPIINAQHSAKPSAATGNCFWLIMKKVSQLNKNQAR